MNWLELHPQESYQKYMHTQNLRHTKVDPSIKSLRSVEDREVIPTV